MFTMVPVYAALVCISVNRLALVMTQVDESCALPFRTCRTTVPCCVLERGQFNETILYVYWSATEEFSFEM